MSGERRPTRLIEMYEEETFCWEGFGGPPRGGASAQQAPPDSGYVGIRPMNNAEAKIWPWLQGLS
jgi:hypothetical protein